MQRIIIFIITLLILQQYELKADSSFFISDSLVSKYTHADSLRGSIFPERKWWDVQRYDLTIKPEYETKSISGMNEITYKVLKNNIGVKMQIDLQEPMIIDSIISNENSKVNFQKDGSVWYVDIPQENEGTVNSALIYFHGKPKESKFPPWDGGWIWKQDSLGNPWMSAACQGAGASLWYPCKDHQSDEPDSGASMTIIASNDLTGVSNGRFVSRTDNGDGTASFKWEVKYPINNYNLIPYIGKYTEVSEIYPGKSGDLDLSIWVLDYNKERAVEHILPEVKKMLAVFEFWFGSYPFYKDSYKIVEAPFAGMEHQSAIAYGNKFMNGFWGMDRSGTGNGLGWDYMIVHESAHEWFGNSITANDIADMWIHEGFADYSETLYIEYWYGKEASNDYNKGLRKTITNKKPVIGDYGVNNEGNSDMYAKASNMIHTIRHSINNDEVFRNIIKGLTKTFFHKNVDTKQIENYISENSGFDFSKVFDQYLRTTRIPEFQYYFSDNGNKVTFRYADCIPGFNLPLNLKLNNIDAIKINPTTEWQSINIMPEIKKFFSDEYLSNQYYLNIAEIIKR